MDIIGNKVGQIAIFGMIPHHFHRVQVWGIGWQPLDLEPIRMGSLEQMNGLAMRAQPVQHDDKLVPQPPVQKGQEGDHLLGADVVLMDLKVQTQPPTPRCNRDRRNQRQTIPAIPAVLNRRLAAWRVVLPKNWTGSIVQVESVQGR